MVKDKSIVFLLDFLLLVYFAELVFPRMIVLGNSSVIRLFCSMSWLALSYLFCPRFYNNSNVHRFFVIIFYFATILFPYFWGYSVISHRYASLAMIPIGVLIYEFYKENDLLIHLKRVIYSTILLSLCTLLTTFFALLLNPYVSRSIKSSGELTFQLYSRGIGGYSFVYYVVVCSQLVFFLFLKNKGIKKIIYLLLYVLMFCFTIKTNYFTALSLLLLGTFIMGTIFLYSNSVSHKFLLFVCLVSGFFAILNFQMIFDTIGYFFPKRFHSILLSEYGDNSLLSAIYSEFLFDRWPMMQQSLIAFFYNPLGGIMPSGELGFKDGYLTGFGQHSHILDTFALYGALIGVVNIFVLMKPFKINGLFVKCNLTLTIPVMVVSLGLYLFNTATESIALAVGVFYPYVRDCIVDGNGRKKIVYCVTQS